MKRYINLSFSFLILLFPFYLLSQPVNNITQGVSMPSPNATSLGQYGDIPVGYYTGVPNVSIPIHTLQEGSLSLPISLSYHSSGIRPGEISSWVGAGWSLQAGGIISRTVQGIPDEGPDGYLQIGAGLGLDIDNCVTGAGPTPIVDFANGIKDGEPDIFSFSVGGYNGKFYITPNVDSSTYTVLIPQQDVQITYEFSGNGIGDVKRFKSFTITTPNGVQYIFGDIGDGNPAIEVSKINENLTSWTANNWYLKQIKSHDNIDVINFQYRTEEYRYHNRAFGGYTALSSYTANWTDVESGYQIDYIETNTEKVIFIPGANRQDIGVTPEQAPDAPKELSAIKIESNNSNYCKEFILSHSYFQDNTVHKSNSEEDFRLRLDSVKEKSCAGSLIEIPAYELEYFGMSGDENYLPTRLTSAIDHWGYFNGAFDNTKSGRNIPYTKLEYNNSGTQVEVTEGNSDRESKEEEMRWGTLKKITYPTGGSTSFELEANQYFEPDPTLIGLKEIPQVNIKGESCTNEPNNADTETSDFIYISDISKVRYVWTKEALAGGPCCGSGSPFPSATITIYKQGVEFASVTTSGLSCSSNNFESNSGYLTDLTENLTNTGYTFKISVLNMKSTFKLLEEEYVENSNRITGGLRVKEITTHDGINISNDIVKTYTYEDINDSNKSSGVLYNKPIYGYVYSYQSSPCNTIPQQNYTTHFWLSQGVVPLADFEGHHIAYARVEETLNGGNNGYNQYIFHTEPIFPPISVSFTFPTPPSPVRVNAGNLLVSSQFSNNGQQVALKRNTIHPDQYTQSSGTFIKALWASGGGTSIGVWTDYTIRNKPYRLATVESILDGVSTITSFEYGSSNHLAPTVSEFTNSNNKTYRSDYLYSKDANGAAYDLMRDRNILTVIEQTKSIDDVLVDGVKTEFGSFSGQPRPWKSYRYERTWDANGNLSNGVWDLQNTILTYNINVGKPHRVQQNGWEEESFTWDTVNKQIKSRQYKDFIWTYNYHPNTRLVSEIIDIDGQDTDYQYDPLMRLKTITARDGNATTHFTYHFQNGNGDKNYVKTRSEFSPIVGSELTWQESWQYMDGLGRSMQTVQRRHTEDQYDVVMGAVEYDNQGRVVKQYEPFAGNYNSGVFVDPSGEAFTLNEYYFDPLHRIEKVTPPDWYATTFQYVHNNSPINVGGITYPANSLRKSIIIDPEDIQSITYTDKKGRTILSQTKRGNDETSTNTIYDDKDRIKTVLPPGVTNQNSPLAYQYQYDGADNIIKKYIPDAGWSSFVYDTRNLATATQHANLFDQQKWLSIKYDDYGRSIETGFLNQSVTPPGDNEDLVIDYSLTTTQYDKDCGQNEDIYMGKTCQTMTRILNSNDWIESNLEYDIFGRPSFMSGNSYINLSTGSEQTTLTYDYADNLIRSHRVHQANGLSHDIIDRMTYDHEGRIKNTYHQIGSGAEQLITQQEYTVKDQLKVKHLAGVGNSFLQSCDFTYLENGFLKTMNDHNAQGNDLFSFELTYDAFAGYNIPHTTYGNGNISTMTWQVKGQNGKHKQAFQYDFLNRLIDVDHVEIINGSNANYDQYNSAYSYDERGNITALTRNGVYKNGNNWTSGLIDDLTYTYTSNTNQLKRVVDAVNPITACPSTRNITNPIIGNQIKEASQSVFASSLVDGTGTTTFRGGNNVDLQSGFEVIASNDGNFSIEVGNCQSIDPNINGFLQTSNTTNIDYLYDANGNMTFDPNKNMVIEYNHLNLPERIIKDNDKVIDFVYDAAGIKVGKIVSTLTAQVPIYKQSYCGGIEYRGQKIEAIYHAEGRVYNKNIFDNTTTNLDLRYEYTLKDHLGNSRITFYNENGVAKVLQENR